MAAPMRKLISFSIAILLLSGCSQAVEMPAPEPTPKQLSLDHLKSRADKLLIQMASDHYKTREKATNKLRKLLKQAAKSQKGFIAYLGEKLKESEDAEVKQRLETILDPYLRPWKYFTRLRTIKGHTDDIRSVTLSPDGKLLASASEDKTVRIWNPCTGAHLRTIQTGNYINTVAFRPNGNLLASGGSKVCLWNPSTGECLRMFKGQTPSITSLAFCPNGSLLASGSAACSICLWNPETGQQIWTVEEQTGQVTDLAFSHDGNILCSATNGMKGAPAIYMRKASTGSVVLTLSEKGLAALNSVAFSPEDNFLASGSYDGILRIWDATDGVCLTRLHVPGGLEGVVFSGDGQVLASAGSDGSIRIWSANNGECLRVLGHHSEQINTLVFSPCDKLLISGSDDDTIIIWGIPEE